MTLQMQVAEEALMDPELETHFAQLHKIIKEETDSTHRLHQPCAIDAYYDWVIGGGFLLPSARKHVFNALMEDGANVQTAHFDEPFLAVIVAVRNKVTVAVEEGIAGLPEGSCRVSSFSLANQIKRVRVSLRSWLGQSVFRILDVKGNLYHYETPLSQADNGQEPVPNPAPKLLLEGVADICELEQLLMNDGSLQLLSGSYTKKIVSVVTGSEVVMSDNWVTIRV